MNNKDKNSLFLWGFVLWILCLLAAAYIGINLPPNADAVWFGIWLPTWFLPMLVGMFTEEKLVSLRSVAWSAVMLGGLTGAVVSTWAIKADLPAVWVGDAAIDAALSVMAGMALGVGIKRLSR